MKRMGQEFQNLVCKGAMDGTSGRMGRVAVNLNLFRSKSLENYRQMGSGLKIANVLRIRKCIFRVILSLTTS